MHFVLLLTLMRSWSICINYIIKDSDACVRADVCAHIKVSYLRIHYFSPKREFHFRRGKLSATYIYFIYIYIYLIFKLECSQCQLHPLIVLQLKYILCYMYIEILRIFKNNPFSNNDAGSGPFKIFSGFRVRTCMFSKRTNLLLLSVMTIWSLVKPPKPPESQGWRASAQF